MSILRFPKRHSSPRACGGCGITLKPGTPTYHRYCSKCYGFASFRRAVAEQVDLQRDHVAWWGATVRGPGRFGNSRRPGLITDAEAEAVAEQVDLQRDHVAWWRASVRGDGRPSKTAADRGQLSQADAEHITSISNQQVSKWGAKLRDAEKYQAQLEAKARKSAGLEESDNHRAQGTIAKLEDYWRANREGRAA